MLTPWLSYRKDLQRAPQRFWTDLGRIEAYAETLCGFPLGPGTLDRLTIEVRANAARAAAAAEFGPEIMAAPGGDDLAEAVGALFDVIDRRPDAPPGLHRHLLEAEGVEFRDNGTLDLELYRWAPRRRATRK